ncbi:MAG: hypothetical protein ABEJ35_03700 [Halobacteriaceae archaeon]
MSGPSDGRRERETLPVKYFRKAVDRTNPFVPPAVLLLVAVIGLGLFFIYFGPLLAPLALLAVTILIALALEVYERASARD